MPTLPLVACILCKAMIALGPAVIAGGVLCCDMVLCCVCRLQSPVWIGYVAWRLHITVEQMEVSWPLPVSAS